MSNTYFTINTVDKIKGLVPSESYENDMRLSLTKYVGEDLSKGAKGLQITCQISSSIESISGTGYEVSKYTDKNDNLN